MNLIDIATIASAIAAVVATIISLLDFRERRDRRRRRFQRPGPQTMPSGEPAVPTTPPTMQPSLEAAPTAWGAPVPAVDTGRLVVGFEGVLAYLLGIVAYLPLMFSRRREVRYHALQSLGIDILTVGYILAVTIVGVVYSIVRYGADPLPQNDPMLNAAVGGLFVVELLPRFYGTLQVLRAKPARIPLVWRVAATIANRKREPQSSTQRR